MSRKIKIGLIQAGSKIGDIKWNVEKAIQKIEEGSSEAAEIICFPELFIPGYDMNFKRIYSSDELSKNFEYVIDKICNSARKMGVWLALPMGFSDKGKVYNSTFLIDRKGNVFGRYDKVHLFEKEKEIFDSGEEFKVWDTDFGKVGIMMCYDAGFPESARSLTLKGSEIILCPSAWRIQDRVIWNMNIFQRAFENTVFVAGINSVSKTEKLHLFGESKVVSPAGVLVAGAGIDREENLICEIDLDEIKKYREKFHYLKDRKPKVYEKI